MLKISGWITKITGTCLLIAGIATNAAAAKKEFGPWLQDVKAEAISNGIRPAIVKEAFADVKFKAKIISYDRKQPEVTQTFQQYMANRLPKSLVNQGKARLRDHRKILAEVSEKYGVQPRFIVALWGVETRFGKYTGGFNVVEALTTLAYDNRRANYFRGELMIALRILNENHITAKNMKGSWGGPWVKPSSCPPALSISLWITMAMVSAISGRQKPMYLPPLRTICQNPVGNTTRLGDGKSKPRQTSINLW
ncbi:MAG: lytic murein transglycosylase [Sneathiella sp.]|nr:lytic murein transglycosylase [Sneathiella sp.]